LFELFKNVRVRTLEVIFHEMCYINLRFTYSLTSSVSTRFAYQYCCPCFDAAGWASRKTVTNACMSWMGQKINGLSRAGLEIKLFN